VVAKVVAGDDAEGADGCQRTGLGAPQRVGAIAVPDTLTLGAARQIDVTREYVRVARTLRSFTVPVRPSGIVSGVS
jgi:hypothetical protein